MTQTAFLFHQFDCYHITEKLPSPSKGKLQDKKGGSRHVIRYCSRKSNIFLSTLSTVLLAWPYQTWNEQHIAVSVISPNIGSAWVNYWLNFSTNNISLSIHAIHSHFSPSCNSQLFFQLQTDSVCIYWNKRSCHAQEHNIYSEYYLSVQILSMFNGIHVSTARTCLFIQGLLLHTEATVRCESFILPMRAGVESNTQASISRTWALITNGATKLCIWTL